MTSICGNTRTKGATMKRVANLIEEENIFIGILWDTCGLARLLLAIHLFWLHPSLKVQSQAMFSAIGCRWCLKFVSIPSLEGGWVDRHPSLYLLFIIYFLVFCLHLTSWKSFEQRYGMWWPCQDEGTLGWSSTKPRGNNLEVSPLWANVSSTSASHSSWRLHPPPQTHLLPQPHSKPRFRSFPSLIALFFIFFLSWASFSSHLLSRGSHPSILDCWHSPRHLPSPSILTLSQVIFRFLSPCFSCFPSKYIHTLYTWYNYHSSLPSILSYDQILKDNVSIFDWFELRYC